MPDKPTLGKVTSGLFSEQHPERTDIVNIKFELEYEAFKRHEKAIKTLKPRFDVSLMTAADTFNLDYTFCIDYHKVSESLGAIMELCDDPDVIHRLVCPSLERERILVYEVLKKLDATIAKVKQESRNET